MTGTGAKRVVRRFDRRATRLVVLGLVASLAATCAIAAIVVSATRSADVSIQPLSLRAEPSTQTVAPGTAAQYAVRVTRRQGGPRGLSGRTELSVGRELPAGAKGSFTPQRGLASSTTPQRST